MSRVVRYSLTELDIDFIIRRAAWLGRLRFEEIAPYLDLSKAENEREARRHLYIEQMMAVTREVRAEPDVQLRLNRGLRNNKQ